MTTTIKFNLHNVTNGTETARVHYSRNVNTAGEDVVTLYAKSFDCGDALREIFGADVYTNNTDMQSDVFDRGHVTLRVGHPLYAAACAAADRKSAPRARAARVVPMAVIETDKTDAEKRIRNVRVSCGKVAVSIAFVRGGLFVLVEGASHRRAGRFFHSIELAAAAYKSPEMAEIFATVATSKPRFHVRATVTPVAANQQA